MKVQIALSPHLSLTAMEFVELWNANPDCQALAEAEESQLEGMGGFPLDPEMMRQGLVFLGGIITTLALDAVKDVAQEQIKALLTQWLKDKLGGKKPPVIQVKTVEQSDGSILFVVHEAGS